MDDQQFLFAAGVCISILAIVIASVLFFRRKHASGSAKGKEKLDESVKSRVATPKRAVVSRVTRQRLKDHLKKDGETNVRAMAGTSRQPAEDEAAAPDLEGAADADGFEGKKVGKKKLAKLESKAEKKAQREADEQLREERKQQQAAAEEERRQKQEKEDEEERAKEEQERKEKEERERKEHEAYLQMKQQFTVEDEGFEETEEDLERTNLLQSFIDFIKEKKIVVLEDLASEFKLKTQDAIDRLLRLQADGLITGVIDDRGKYIYISPEELRAVAKFIKQRGRVSVSELAECSNQLINLTLEPRRDESAVT